MTIEGRDWTVEPTIEQAYSGLKMDNAVVNAAHTALHILKSKLGDFANPVSVSLNEYLIGEVANVEKIKEIEELEALVKSSPKSSEN